MKTLILAISLTATVLVCEAMPGVSAPASLDYRMVVHQAPRSVDPAAAFQEQLVQPVGKSKNRIIDGEYAADCQFPHQVALYIFDYYGNAVFCGGSLITDKWVLTAAHCVENSYRGINVRGGSTNREQGFLRKSKRIFYHGNYHISHLRFDMALIEMNETVPLSDCVKPIQLESTGCGEVILDELVARVSGWGGTSTGGSVTNYLKWTDARVISNRECLEAYNENHVVDSTLCTMPYDERHQGTLCQGDSGGPLLRNDTGRQIGVNSFTSSAGCSVNLPSGYARVPCFTNWINYIQSL